jgi:glycosyltransferase involved in cell wall biosynthesis
MGEISSIAISWYFLHHAEHNGYKQILKITRPWAVVGIDERMPRTADRLPRKYPWLYEFRAARLHKKNACQILHILYGETYFRFSPWLFAPTPIVATFHQPPQLLRQRLTLGDETGRISKIVHRLTKKRFEKLSAAIIISEEQRPVLEQFVPANRIHYIPLGASTLPLIEAESRLRQKVDHNFVLTVGNWLRDWEFYFGYLDYCRDQRPDWIFHLVNRNLPSKWHERACSTPNLKWDRDIDDESLLRAYAKASCVLLPLVEASGNNTVNEALAMGCPVVTNVPLGVPDEKNTITLVEKSFDAFSDAIATWQNCSIERRVELRSATQNAVRSLDWSIVGEKTISLYKSLI